MRKRGAWGGVRTVYARGFTRRALAMTGALLVLLTQAHWLNPAQGASLAPTATAVVSAPNPSSYGQIRRTIFEN